MCYPRVEISLDKIRNNTSKIVYLCHENGISVVGVTKVFCANDEIVKVMIRGGIDIIGDSRIENLKRLKSYKLPKLLLRLPMISEAREVVKYADISLNSEIDTIKILSKEAIRIAKKHNIILMIDLGDLREGIFHETLIYKTVEKILLLDSINLIGIGTNLTCYGGVLPDKNNLKRLISIKENIQEKYKLDIKIVSGGNSSSIHLLKKSEMPKGINQLRVGEAIILGRETAYGNPIQHTYQDALILKCEIIELQNKPSKPIGVIGIDAFGNKPLFEDNGIRKRAICAIGKQDIYHKDIIPIDKNIEIIGSSSDHLILDVTNCKKKYKVGSKVEFKMTYGGALSVFTSKYVKKIYV